MLRFLCAVLVVAAIAMPSLADYASTVLSLAPEGYWRMSEAEPIPGAALVNYGTAGEAGNGTWGFTDAADSQPLVAAGPTAADGFAGFGDTNQGAQLINNAGTTYHQFNLGSATFMNNESQSYSFMYRHNGDASTDGERLIVNDQGMDNDFRVILYGYRIVVCTGTSYGASYAVATSDSISFINAWRHVVVVRNGDLAYNAKIYVNGVEYGLTEAPDSFSKYTGGDANIGARFPWDNGWGNYTGLVDEVATYGRALTAEEAQTLYTAAITAAPTPHPGDTDNNGTVDVTDLGNLSTAYGTTSGATWLMGDFDGNGMVDVTDLGILSTEYGWVATPPTAGAVPEPATLALLSLGGLALIRRKRS